MMNKTQRNEKELELREALKLNKLQIMGLPRETNNYIREYIKLDHERNHLLDELVLIGQSKLK